MYRAQPARWLESLVREEVTRSGRLAIIELKASEHIRLPLQAADYRLRIRKHLERLGYFPGIGIRAAEDPAGGVPPRTGVALPSVNE